MCLSFLFHEQIGPIHFAAVHELDPANITQVDKSCLAGIMAGYFFSDGSLWLLQIVMQTTS